MRRSRMSVVVCAGILGFASVAPVSVVAAWPADPLVNVPLCTDSATQVSPTIVTDGAGGAIVTWSDSRNANNDIFAQRVGSDGATRWTADGVPVCITGSFQNLPRLVSDGTGGAVITWLDGSVTQFDIYAQRISADGVCQWTAAGVALTTAAGGQESASIAPDGTGGAIVAWHDYPSSNSDIHAQRVSGDGVVQWTTNGVAVCAAVDNQRYPTAASDGLGGAIIAWRDSRSGTSHIYAQRLSSAGVAQWTTDGVAVCTADPHGQYSQTIIADGAGGAIIAWRDSRGDMGDIYAQRISSAGAVQWTFDGVALCTAMDNQQVPAIVADGTGGAIVAWVDPRAGSSDIYAQRISAAGAVLWTADGVAVCTATGEQLAPTVATDGAGGVIVTWSDQRSGTTDIYAQRISAAGTVQWTADGVALCTAGGAQEAPMITTAAAGGAIVTWYDYRDGGADIYAQRVRSDGQLGGDVVAVPGETTLGCALDSVYPNPSSGEALMVRFTLMNATVASLELYDLAGRRIASREVGALGAGQHTLALAEGRRLASGHYLLSVRQGGQTRTARVTVLR